MSPSLTQRFERAPDFQVPDNWPVGQLVDCPLKEAEDLESCEYGILMARAVPCEEDPGGPILLFVCEAKSRLTEIRHIRTEANDADLHDRVSEGMLDACYAFRMPTQVIWVEGGKQFDSWPLIARAHGCKTSRAHSSLRGVIYAVITKARRLCKKLVGHENLGKLTHNQLADLQKKLNATRFKRSSDTRPRFLRGKSPMEYIKIVCEYWCP